MGTTKMSRAARKQALAILEKLVDELIGTTGRDSLKERWGRDEYWTQIQETLEHGALYGARYHGQWPDIKLVLNTLAEMLEDGVPLSPACAAWLSECLRNIADGQDHLAAFSIRRERGEKDDSEAADTAFFNALVVEALRRKEGLTKEKAIAKLSSKTKIPED